MFKRYKTNKLTINGNNKYEDNLHKIKRMNKTFNYKYKNIKFEDKTIQTTKIIYPNTINNIINKKSGLLNKTRIIQLKNNNNFFIKDEKKLDEKTINRTELIKPSILKYTNKSDKNLFFKNNRKYKIRSNNNINLKIDEEEIKNKKEIKFNNKKIIQDKNNKENSSNKVNFKDISNFTEYNIINEYQEKKDIYKNRCINIYTLLSLKKNNL